MIKNQNFSVASRRYFYIKTGIVLLLVVWFSFLMAEKTDLVTADLGRHLQNGKWVIENHFNLLQKDSPIHENFYSFVNPDFPFVNHHWASGVVFYWLYKLSGFAGLSISYIFLSVLTFLIFFYIAYRESDFTIAAVLSFFLIPLMAERREIRPEIWSYLFAAVFFLVIWLWNNKKISGRWLLALPILTMFWVNLHIYFFLGFFIIGVFLISEIGEIIFSRLTDEIFSEKIQKIKWLFAVLLLSLAGSLINPFGWRGTIHPLTVYHNYGYTVLEEKSVWFLENYGLANTNFLLIKVVLVSIVISFFLLLAVNRKKVSVPYTIFAIFFGVIGWLAIRNFTLLGFFALPVLSHNSGNVFRQKPGEINFAKENGIAVLYIMLMIIGLIANYQFVLAHQTEIGVGLKPEVQKAADFIKRERISGPIFNNYDIGGYLIWNLPPEQKIFVDNRPEAYPDSFFSGVYKPMQENPDIFEKIDQEYNFNTIIFYRNDITPWGMNFLKTIGDNPNWAKVFEDNYAVIYLKRSGKNESIIQKY